MENTHRCKQVEDGVEAAVKVPWPEAFVNFEYHNFQVVTELDDNFHVLYPPKARFIPKSLYGPVIHQMDKPFLWGPVANLIKS